MKTKTKLTINTRIRIQELAAVAAVAGLCLAGRVEGATNLVDFEFNEGPGATATVTKAKDLTGTFGQVINPANDPVFTNDAPSQQAGDSAIVLNGVGFLVADDSSNPVLAIQSNAFTIESWLKWDYTIAKPIEGIVGYGGSYKLGCLNGNLVLTAFGIADINSTVAMPYDGLWHHVAAVWQPGVGVTFYLDGVGTSVEYTNAFQAPVNNLLTMGGERLDNPFSGALDRLRIHKAALTADQLDSVAASPKGVTANTVVAYNFNETALPCQSATTPARPAISSETYLHQASSPTFTADSPSGRVGDYALQFTGGAAGTYVLAPDDNGVIALDATNPSFTLEAWVKPGTQGQARAVLFGYNGPGGAFSFSVTSARQLFVTTYGIADTTSQATIPNDGLWHHVAVVHQSGKELRFYVDGLLADTVPYTGGVLVGVRTDTTLVLGAEPGPYNPYVGLLDRVRITSGVLSADQLDSLAIPGVNPGAPSLATATVQQVSWPTIPPGYVLQSSPRVDDATSWAFVTNTPLVVGTNYTLYLPLSGTKTFYRLVKP